MACSDAEYIKTTVGAVLAKGVAETLASSPEDPVQYLGQWLHRHVSNVKFEETVARKAAEQAAADEAAKQDLIAAVTAKQAIQDAKEAAIKQVCCVPPTQILVYIHSRDASMLFTSASSADRDARGLPSRHLEEGS